MSSRQPGRPEVVAFWIIGLCIILIWAEAGRVIDLGNRPLATWEQSVCKDPTPDAASTPDPDVILLGVHAEVPSGRFRGPSEPSRMALCALRATDGALVRGRLLLPGRMNASTINPTIRALRRSGDTLYLAEQHPAEQSGRICALRVAGGEPLWCQATHGAVISRQLFVEDGVVLSETNTTLEAFDARDGTQLWQQDEDVDRGAQSPIFIVSAGVVYSGDHHSSAAGSPPAALTLCARSLQNGAPRWCQTLGSGTERIVRLERGAASVYAIVEDATGGSTAPRISALSASDGAVRWSRDLACTVSTAFFTAVVPAVDAAAHELLIVGEEACTSSSYRPAPYQLTALRAGDGSTLWEKQPGVVSAASAVGDTLYLAVPEVASDGRLVWPTTIRALRMVDAAPVWSASIPDLAASLMVTGDTVIVTTGYFWSPSRTAAIYALRRADGRQLWLSAGCAAPLDPLFWHDHIQGHAAGAPAWCHWLTQNQYNISFTPVDM